MIQKKKLPIGNDEFREVRELDYYYVDKSLMIKDFLEMGDKVALIARPRRFGKSLNITMLKEFFDIMADSRRLFEGLAIMETPYAARINSLPVIYFTFKNCRGATVEELIFTLKRELLREYLRYADVVAKLPAESFDRENFFDILDTLKDKKSSYIYLTNCLVDLTRTVEACFREKPILLIDEYDQPIMSSYEYGYHDELGAFFSTFYGAAMKGNPFLKQALLTGIQRVAKESIFSQLNNPQIYTVIDREYAPYFGMTPLEVDQLLQEYGLELTDEVQKMYNGYQIGGFEMYNPWSILNYAKRGCLGNYWVRTSSNFLVRKALSHADKNFWDRFDELAAGKSTTVWLTLDTSFVERESNYSLWGLLANAGYITIVKRIDFNSAVVRIPNEEVMAEFQMLVTEIAGIDGQDLRQMLSCLLQGKMDTFFSLYKDIVISCTSYMDARENAYHMLFLGMCITLRGNYEVTSNLEAGYGRSDITLRALIPKKPNIIVEFKQGPDIENLAEQALEQIIEQKYYCGLKGTTICVGLAHDKKKCQLTYKKLDL
ncbi:AAA family ATPase [Clostridium sp. MCC353]|uniref:AAA family ATPase n=1 Tax=Clostridium sp. MCC353 TaxID=2592646 RepID=UPI001C02380A